MAALHNSCSMMKHSLDARLAHVWDSQWVECWGEERRRSWSRWSYLQVFMIVKSVFSRLSSFNRTSPTLGTATQTEKAIIKFQFQWEQKSMQCSIWKMLQAHVEGTFLQEVLRCSELLCGDSLGLLMGITQSSNFADEMPKAASRI